MAEDKLIKLSTPFPQPLEVQAPSPTQVGSLHWFLSRTFNNDQEAVGWLEEVSMGSGEMYAPMGKLARVVREWIDSNHPWDWNKAGKVAGVKTEHIMKQLSEGMREIGKLVGGLKVSMEVGGLIDMSLRSAMVEGRQGFSDRKMLLEIAGVVEKSGGVNVQVNQNNVGIGIDALKGGGLKALNQFSDTERELDTDVRERMGEDEVIEGEIVEESEREAFPNPSESQNSSKL